MAGSPRSERGPISYELRLQGHLDRHWFAGMTLTQNQDGTTSVAGTLADQAELHGLLAKVRDLGATLLSVTSARSGATAEALPELQDRASRGGQRNGNPREPSEPETAFEADAHANPPRTHSGEQR